MNDIWNKLVDRLLDPEQDEDKKVSTFMTLLDMEVTIGQDEVDELIIDRRKNNENDSSL